MIDINRVKNQGDITIEQTHNLNEMLIDVIKAKITLLDEL